MRCAVTLASIFIAPVRLARSFAVGQTRPDGHTNRVFSVKFHPSDTNMVVTAGWDKTVQVWDLREHKPVRHVYNPFVCGDTLDIDVQRNVLLTGSYADKDALQVYDLGSLKLLSSVNTSQPSHVYAAQLCTPPVTPPLSHAQFLKGEHGYIVAAGSNANELRIVSEDRAEAPSFLVCLRRDVAQVLGVQASPSAFYTLDGTADGALIVAAGADKAGSARGDAC